VHTTPGPIGRVLAHVLCARCDRPEGQVGDAVWCRRRRPRLRASKVVGWLVAKARHPDPGADIILESEGVTKNVRLGLEKVRGCCEVVLDWYVNLLIDTDGVPGGAALRRLCTKSIKIELMTDTTQLVVTFLGTRGEIEARSRQHRRHSSIIVECSGARVMIDCGADWGDLVVRVSPTAIVLTHAHRDRAAGLARGAPCPVYATARTWRSLSTYPIRDRRVMPVRKPIAIGAITFEAFAAEHSIRAPAVGYRISAGHTRLFYVPDVVAIGNRRRALQGLALYVGDGAAVNRPIVRRRGRALIGHTSIRKQLDWCRMERIGIALFTHCGSEIVTGDSRRIRHAVHRLGAERGVEARVANDGLRLVLNDCKSHCADARGTIRTQSLAQNGVRPSHARR
jgi:Beta-lactamase superfamily domain